MAFRLQSFFTSEINGRFKQNFKFLERKAIQYENMIAKKGKLIKKDIRI